MKSLLLENYEHLHDYYSHLDEIRVSLMKARAFDSEFLNPHYDFIYCHVLDEQIKIDKLYDHSSFAINEGLSFLEKYTKTFKDIKGINHSDILEK